ncbi:mucin-17-like [Littorina saxatilis]
MTVDVKSGEGNTRFAEMSLGTGAFLMHQDYNISFATRTYFGDVIATHQVKTNLTIVKYDAVQSLHVRTDEDNSTLLQVEWSFPGIAAGLLAIKRFECRVHVTATSKPWMEYNATVPMSDDDCGTKKKVRVTGLHADVNYTVSMQFRPEGGKYWSEDAVSSNTTSEDVPSGAPEVTAGSYEIFFRDGNYQLTVYWKALEPQYRNGKLTNYKVVVTRSDQSIFSTETTADVLSATIPHFQPTSGGNACVSAATSKGYSSETNCITILTFKDDPKVPSPPEEVTVEYMASTNFSVLRWHDVTPISATGDHFAVFWCRGTLSGPPVNCLSDLNWTKLDNISATSYTVDALRSPGSLEDQTTWRFGVARNIGNLSRGISWNKCSFRDDAEKRVPNIAPSSKGGEISVTLTVMCDVPYFSQRPVRQEIYVTRMTSSFGGSDCTKGHKVDVTFNPDLSRTVVVKDNLTLNSVYSVCARTYFANNGNGVVSGPSNVSLTEIAVSDQDDSVLHRAIAGSVSVALVMAVLFCVWLFWKKGKRARHKFTTSVDDDVFEIKRPRRGRRPSPPGEGFSNGSFTPTITTIEHTQPNAPPANLPPPTDKTSGRGHNSPLHADQVREIPFVPTAAPVTAENIHPRPKNLAENQQPANPCGVGSPQQPVTNYLDYLGIALSDEQKHDAEPLADAMLDRSRGEVSGFGELPVEHASGAPSSASIEASSSILSTAYVQVATNRSPPPQPPPLQELEVQVYEVTASPHTGTKDDGVSQESSGASVDSSSASSVGSLCSADTTSSGEDSSSQTSGNVTATTLNGNVEDTASQANTVTFELDALSRPSPNITVIAVGTGLSSDVQKADSALKSGYVQDMLSFGDTNPTEPPLSRSLNSDDSSSKNTRGTALPAYVATTAVEKSLPEEDSTTTPTTEVRMTREHPEPDYGQHSAQTVTDRVHCFQGSQNGLKRDEATLTNEKDADDSPNGCSTNESEKDNKLVETPTNRSEPDYISKEVQGNKPSSTESDRQENGTRPEGVVNPNSRPMVNPYVRLDDEYPRCEQLNGSDGLKPTPKPLQFSNDITGTNSTSDSDATDTNSSGSTSPDDCNSRSVEITTDNSGSTLGSLLKHGYVPQLSTHRQGSVLSNESGYCSPP